MIRKITLSVALMIVTLISMAQTITESRTLDYDPEKLKIIPDKVFEIGLPLLFIFLLLNTIVSVLKNKAEHQLKMKMIEKGVSEETLVTVFKETNAIRMLQPLKGFLFSLAIGLSLLIIHFSRDYMMNRSGYLAIGIFLLFISAAFLLYYKILQKKL